MSGKKIHFIIVAIVISGLFIFGTQYYYKHQQSDLRRRQHEKLQAIARLKADQLTQWHQERLSEASFFSINEPYSSDMQSIMAGNHQSREKLKYAFLQILTNNRYQNIFLLNKSGQIRFSIDSEFNLVDPVTFSFANEVFEKGEILVTDFYYCNVHKEIHYEIIAPVFNNNKEVIAVLIFRIDPADYLYPLLQEWPAPNKSAETYIVKVKGDSVYFLNSLLHADNSMLQMAFPLTLKENTAVKAALGVEGLVEGIDYRGEEVLADIKRVPGTSWYIISEIDIKEIYSDLRRHAIMIDIITFLLILFACAAVAWVYNLRQRKIYKELLQKRTELFESQEEYGATLYSIGDGVITTDDRGNIKNLNLVAEKLTEWTEKEAKGKNIEEVFNIINEETKEKVENPVSKVLREGKIVGLANHTTLISRGGKEIPITDSGAPIKDIAGNIVGTVMVFSDQSEERLRNKLIGIRLRVFEFAIDHSLNEVLAKMLDEIGILFKSPLVFFNFMISDQETLWSQSWSTTTCKECHIPQGSVQTRVGESGNWADFIQWQKPVINNDKSSVISGAGLPDGHPELNREIVVPVLREDKVVAVLGIANKPDDYKETDIELISFLADITWEIAEHKFNERQLASIVGNLPGFVYRCKYDKEWTMLYLSKRCGDITGYKIEDLLSNNAISYNDIIVEGFHDEIYKKWQYAVKNRTNFSHEYQIRTALGNIKWVLEQGVGVYDENGNLLFLEGYIEDISERKKAECQLVDSEAKFRRLFHDHAAVKFIIDPDEGRIIDANEAAADFYGWSIKELTKMKISEINILSPEEVQKKMQEAKNLKNIYFEFKHRKANGEIVDIENFSSRVIIGGKEYLHSIIHDITEKKEAENALLESEEQNRLLMSNSMDAILLTKPDGSVITANDAACEMFGMTKDEICFVGRDGIVDMKDPSVNKLLRIRDKYGFARGEISFIRKDGTKFPAEVTSSIFTNKKGEIFTSMIIRDITERRKWESELMNAKEKAEESDRLKSAFLTNVSHEIRTPMNGILGFLELLKEPELDEKQKNIYIDIVNKSGHRLLDTINDIIEISKIETGVDDLRLEEVDINEIMDYHYNFFKPQSDEKGLTFIIDEQVNGTRAKVITDKYKLDSILGNLIKNALKFTDKGYIKIGSYVDNNFLKFYVKDTGRGIPVDRLEAIFDRFIQADMSINRSYEGSGLGLSIVKAYIDILGGIIDVQSAPGKGSLFTFSIPYKSSESLSVQEKTEVSKLHGKLPQGLTILVAEDDEISYKLLATILTSHGIKLIRTVNGYDTVSKIQENPGIPIVLMDMKMPGMNGIEATRKIREFNKDIIIIAQTAFAMSGDKDKILDAGCNDYISKPVRRDELLKIIERYLNKASVR